MQRFDQHSDRNDKQIYDVPKVLYFHKRGKMGPQSFFPVVVFADIKHPEKWMILPAF